LKKKLIGSVQAMILRRTAVVAAVAAVAVQTAALPAIFATDDYIRHPPGS
jgi:hypothetical protein